MERRLWNDLRCGMTNAQILNALRETARQEGCAAPYFLEAAAQNATWQWGMTTDGAFLAGMAVVPDPAGDNRGWFVVYPGAILESPFQIRPMFQRFRDLARLGPYDELRAWVVAGSAREERFAAWFGFLYDCGPATGYSPTGLDMNLWLWRR